MDHIYENGYKKKGCVVSSVGASSEDRTDQNIEKGHETQSVHAME
jgi:hypothetical protein